MPENEYVQIDDEKSIFEIMDRMRQLGKETSDANLKFNTILGQKQELYSLAKVLTKELMHDLQDLGTFVTPNKKVVKSSIKRTAPKKSKKIVRKATPKRPVNKSKPVSKKPVSSMQKLKVNMKRAKQSKTQTFNNTTNKIVKKLEI
jgi:hypothetical protein